MSRGRSPRQVHEREVALRDLAEALAAEPMTAEQAVFALAGTRAACGRVTFYSRVAALAERGYDVRRKERRNREPGKTGVRETVFSVAIPGAAVRR